ncbi:hypothetical protein PM082_017552 [Marasmius tenuissimus]|nr:hypothetical protein PM082_017552 [Marasmius tenuissimus]
MDSHTPVTATKGNTETSHSPKHSSRKEEPLVFDVGSWKDNPDDSQVHQWYRKLSGDSIKIDKLQMWKSNTNETFTHRFVALRMLDGIVHRLDRRAATQGDPAILSGLSSRTRVGQVPATDQMEVDVDFEDLEKTNKLEMEISLEGDVKLIVVLLTCYAISKHPEGNAYDIREHNCFFFSWTILMVATRHRLDIKTPTRSVLMERFDGKDHLPVLARSVVVIAVNVFRDLVLMAIATFRDQQQEDNEEGKTIRKGMPLSARILWGLPKGVLEGFGKRVLDAKLPLGLRETLDSQVQMVVREKAPELYKRILLRIDIPVNSRDRLWIDEGVSEIIRAEVQAVLMDLLWPAIVKAITQGFGTNIDSASGIANEVVKGKNWWFAPKRTVQLWAVQNAALHGGLRAVESAAEGEAAEVVRAEAEGKSNVSEQLQALNAGMFDLAWNSARGGALSYAKDAVKATSGSLNPKHHDTTDAKWNTIWKVWDKCWAKACKDARNKALEGLDTVVDAVLNASVKVVLEELGSGSSQPTVKVHETGKFKLFGLQLGSESRRTILELQKHMQKSMKRAKFGRADELQRTMAEIWKRLSAGDFKDFSRVDVQATHVEVPDPIHHDV